MKNLTAIAALFLSVSSFASTPAVVKAVAKQMKADSVKTVITEVQNSAGNPCVPAGLSYNVELMVKTAQFDRMAGKTVYKWESAKLINVSKDGDITEVCAE